MTPLTESQRALVESMFRRAQAEARAWCWRRRVEEGRHADAVSVALEALCIAAPMWREDGGAAWSSYAIGRIRIELYRWHRFDRVVYLPDHIEHRPASASLDDEDAGLARVLALEPREVTATVDAERLRAWLVQRATPERRPVRERHVGWWWSVDVLGESIRDVAAVVGISPQAVSQALQRVRRDIATWPGALEAA